MERRYFKAGKKLHKVWLTQTQAGQAKFRLDEGEERPISYLQINEHVLMLELPEGRVPAHVARRGQEFFVQIRGESFYLREEDGEHGAPEAAGSEDKIITAPMPGKVVKILVQAGCEVKRAQPVIILDSMKVELELKASAGGKVREVLVKEGQQLNMDQPLISFE
jgi:biotin carboxyl carrier protein